MPVFGFKGAGGFTDIISRGVGVLISAFDTKAYSEEIIRLFNDENKQKEYSLNAKKIAVEEYNFPDYIFRLLELSENTVKKVSVIIPNFNYEKYIKQRIQSVLKQNYPVYEIIVLDDHSSDGSVDIIRTELEQSEVNFRLVVNNCNSGSVFDQWHKGASMVRGDYVWIAEADDFSDPDFLGEIMKAFDDDNVVLSFCKSCQVDSGGNIIEGDYQNYLSDISATKWRRTYVNDGLDEIKTAFCVKNTIPNVSSVVFRKNALLSVLNEHLDMVKQYRVAGDWVTYLHVLAKGKIAYSAKAFNYHRRHDSSVTLNRFDERLLAEIMSVQKYVNENFEISAPAIDLAERYAQELYEQFGLKTSESPTINDHAELQRLIK